MAYSDFPIPGDYPNYMHHSKILDYFRMYAQHFKLMRHIRFQVTSAFAQWGRVLATALIHPLSPPPPVFGEECEADTRLFTQWKLGGGD